MIASTSQANKDAIPHAELYDLEPAIEPVPEQDRQILAKQAKAFASLHNNLEKNFYDYNEFYVMSIRWLKRWKVFVSYEEVVAGQKPTRFMGCGQMPTLNEDIIDQKYSIDALELEAPWDHLNIALKPHLQSDVDYILVNKPIWELFDDYPGRFEIKRRMEQTKEGKKVEVYFRRTNIIPLCMEVLREVERDTISKFIRYPVQLPQYILLAPVLEKYGDEIKRALNKHMYYRMVSFSPEMPKLWAVEEGLTERKLLDKFYNGCKCNRSYEYKMGFPGTYLTVQDHTLEKLDISPDTTLALEFKQSSSDWMFFTKKHRITGKCEHCTKIDRLLYSCACNYVAYCSPKCKQEDKTSHRFRCDRNAESSQDEKALTMTEASRRGRVGLRNLGNTCFMNSGIQCLTSVEALTQYFLSGRYESEINVNNPLGTKGELAKAYARLIIQMWYGSDSSVAPTQLKRAIGNFQSMFSGYQQHDSGQLISYLLDGLHQDHNRVKVKPLVENKDYDGRPDEVVALQSWTNFLKRNQSIVTDLMYGQFKSRLDCPKCLQHSITFDPFLMCPIPIPQDNRRNLVLRYLKDNIHTEITTFSFEKDKGVKFQHALDFAYKVFKIPAGTQTVAFGCSTYSCTDIDPRVDANQVRKDYRIKNITIRNLEPEEDPNGIKVVVKHTQVNAHYDSYRKTMANQRFYMFPKSMTTKQLHHKLFSMFRKLVQSPLIKDYENDVLKSEPEETYFKILIDSDTRFDNCPFCQRKSCDNCPLFYSDEWTLEMLSKKIRYFSGALEIEIFWRKDSSKIDDILNAEVKADSSGLGDSNSSSKANDKLNIYDCLKYGQEPEILEEENAWFCPKCKDFVLAKKQLSIYKAPQIMIINFKRFKGKGYRGYLKTKLEAEVDFPIRGLDMTDYVVNPTLPHQSPDAPRQEGRLLYDLFAISNHYGGLGGGHYTAYCKKGDSWQEYDDSSVSPISESQLVGSQSYVLFYKRRKATKASQD